MLDPELLERIIARRAELELEEWPARLVDRGRLRKLPDGRFTTRL